jgi:hypothetical protein
VERGNEARRLHSPRQRNRQGPSHENQVKVIRRATKNSGVRQQADRTLVIRKLRGLRVYVKRLNAPVQRDQKHTEQAHDSNR